MRVGVRPVSAGPSQQQKLSMALSYEQLRRTKKTCGLVFMLWAVHDAPGKAASFHVENPKQRLWLAGVQGPLQGSPLLIGKQPALPIGLAKGSRASQGAVHSRAQNRS